MENEKIDLTKNICFNADIASMYGIHEAIILQNLVFWIDKNVRNKKHYHEYRTWTYNSLDAFVEQYPFFTKNQIEYSVNKLVKEGVIMKGNFNKMKYDRTTWYALVNEEKFGIKYQKSIS